METGIYCLKHVFNGRVHSEEINSAKMLGFGHWPVYPSSSPWILSHKEHIVIGAITGLLRFAGSAGLEGNGYRSRQKSPSDGSHVTPLLLGKNAVGHFSWIGIFSKCFKSVWRQKEGDAKKWIWPIHIWPRGAHFSGMQTLGAFMWMGWGCFKRETPSPPQQLSGEWRKAG